MPSNYKRLGPYIREVNVRNTDLRVTTLLGVSIQKVFMPSIANTIGTDMSTYKIVRKNQFAYGPVTSRNGDKISVALLQDHDEAIISQAYIPFEIIDHNELDPEYLMMWFRRPEFDRYARFKSHGSARESFDWAEMCDTELPVPHIDVQRAMVKEYNTITDRIALNEQLNRKLEETAQALYRHWFVDFEFPYDFEKGEPALQGQPYKSSGGEMEWCEELEKEIPRGWGRQQLKHIVDMRYGKMLDSSNFIESGYPVYSGYGIRGYYSEYMYENPEILVVCRGVSGTGNVVFSPAKSYITNLSIVLSVMKLDFSKQYLFRYLRDYNLESINSGSAQSMITIGDLEPVLVLEPLNDVMSHFEILMTKTASYSENLISGVSSLTHLLSTVLSRMSTVETGVTDGVGVG
jgi:type I restriction enzyme S subunit